MFALAKAKLLSSSINTLAKGLSYSIQSCQSCVLQKLFYGRDRRELSKSLSVSFVHTSSQRYDLMEFFDAKENWGVNVVKVGRSWRKEELRIKSNSDLHKLWFVLLKERNMLLTMEHEAKEKVLLFPNPERLDKVEESMENLECVIRERNRAYFQLETGKTGERDEIVSINQFRLATADKACEYPIPEHMNTEWQNRFYKDIPRGSAVRKFKRLYREQQWLTKKRARNRNWNHVLQLLKRFPHLDRKVLEAHYPDVDLDKAMRNKKTVGHHDANKA